MSAKHIGKGESWDIRSHLCSLEQAESPGIGLRSDMQLTRKYGPRWDAGRRKWRYEMTRQEYKSRPWDSTLSFVENYPTCKSGNIAAKHCGMTDSCIVCRAKIDLPLFGKMYEEGPLLAGEIKQARESSKEWTADCGAHPETFFRQTAQIMQKKQNRELRQKLARYGAVPLSID